MSGIAIAAILSVSFFGPSSDLSSPQPAADVTSGMPIGPEPAHEWMSSFEDATKLAARNRKPLLIHFDATWCGACQRMDAEVLHKPEVLQLLGSSVVGVKVDADQHKDLIAEYKISSLPTEVVVLADGSAGPRYMGAVDLTSYVKRLQQIGSQNAAVVSKAKGKPADATDEQKSTRSCLIVRRDGKMVGLGGFSPVALSVGRQWKKGSDSFVATHEGVDYFFQSEEEVVQFKADPVRFIPTLHGCDPVALFQDNEATSGAIEYGSFYRGKVFFFASVENRSRFESNPGWYSGVSADSFTSNEDEYPFLNTGAMDN